MNAPMRVRPLTDAERNTVDQGLRSSDACTRRRSQVVATSGRGEPIPRIARSPSGNEQAVRNVIHAFNQEGAAALTAQPCAVHDWCCAEAARAQVGACQARGGRARPPAGDARSGRAGLRGPSLPLP